MTSLDDLFFGLIDVNSGGYIFDNGPILDIDRRTLKNLTDREILDQAAGHFHKKIKWPIKINGLLFESGDEYGIDQIAAALAIKRESVCGYIGRGDLHGKKPQKTTLVTGYGLLEFIFQRIYSYNNDLLIGDLSVSDKIIARLRDSRHLRQKDLIDLIFPREGSSEYTRMNKFLGYGGVRRQGQDEPDSKTTAASARQETPQAKTLTLTEILSELELKMPAYILKSEFPFEPNFDFVYAPYSREQNPDAFYVRSPNFVQIGKQWVEPKLKWDDAYRLYLAKSYATRDALKSEFRKRKTKYQEDDLRKKLEAARMGTIVYNKTEVFPHVACDIAVMEMDDVQRIGYLVEPVVKKLGPFVPMPLINILLGSGLVMMPDDQIAKIDVRGEAYLNFFQVVKANENEFTPALTRF